MTGEPNKFASELAIEVYTRFISSTSTDWLLFDRGPGIFHIPSDQLVMIRVRNVDDAFVKKLVKEIEGLDFIRALNLSENRKITNEGLAMLKPLQPLTELNLSSCDISDRGIPAILTLTNLLRLDLSFCSRITDAGILQFRKLPGLQYLNLRGVPKITNGSLSKLRNRNLEIYR